MSMTQQQIHQGTADLAVVAAMTGRTIEHWRARCSDSEFVRFAITDDGDVGRALSYFAESIAEEVRAAVDSKRVPSALVDTLARPLRYHSCLGTALRAVGFQTKGVL